MTGRVSGGLPGGPGGGRAAALAPLVIAAVAAGAGWAAHRVAPGGRDRWERTNHRGEPVTLFEGPAWAAGAATALALAPGLPVRVRAGGVVATAGAAVFGAIDDLTETGSAKGLRGHLGALANGELTTGGLKVLGIGATGVASAALLLERDEHTGRLAHLVDVVVAGGVVAGAANLFNLFDLRPGRVLKIVLAHAPGALTGGAGGPLAGAAVGASLPLLVPDLAERSMLGDCGANAAGAVLGAHMVAATSSGPRGRVARALALAGLVVATLASEKVSFTRVIESTPGLRELDALGRRPAQPSQ